MENLIENNKLIAEFMGVEYRGENYLGNSVGIIDGKKVAELLYNSSWDWLMPVVEKCFGIAKYKDAESGEKIFIKSIHLKFYGPNLNEVYNAIIDFIKWYNHEKKLSHFDFDENGDNVVV